MFEGSQITHVDRSSGTSRTLDYVFISREHFNLVNKVIIDTEMSSITPYRLTGSVSNIVKKFTDHCGMLVTLNLKIDEKIKDEVVKKNKVRTWKMTPESKAMFSCLTDDGADDLLEMIADEDRDINDIIKKVDRFTKDCKNKAHEKRSRTYKLDTSREWDKDLVSLLHKDLHLVPSCLAGFLSCCSP